MEVTSHGCRTPVLFLVQRRPQITSRVLEVIRQARPSHLLVAADGPEDDSRCQETRRLILAGIDWPCTVETLFSPTRQGCKKAVSSALDWAFGLHEQLIILEDDCVPDLSFFSFCDEMLKLYRDVPEIMQICGSNLTGFQAAEESYFFSRFGPIWGWASWRRAWQAYDVNMSCWPEFRKAGRLKKICTEPFEASWRKQVFDAVHQGRVDTWDYQWAFAKLVQGGLSIVPACNLVSNLGFGADSTHTSNPNDPRAALPTESMASPLVHPSRRAACVQADQHYLRAVVGLPAVVCSIAAVRHMIRSLLHR
jgi:hypothetical protein